MAVLSSNLDAALAHRPHWPTRQAAAGADRPDGDQRQTTPAARGRPQWVAFLPGACAHRQAAV